MIRLFSIACFVVVLSWVVMLGGCGPAVGGPRFWWNDQERRQMPADYTLPPLGREAPDAGDAGEKAGAEPEKTAPAKAEDASRKSSSAGAVPRSLQ